MLPEQRELLPGTQRPAEGSRLDQVAPLIDVAINRAHADECSLVVQAFDLEIEISMFHVTPSACEQCTRSLCGYKLRAPIRL